MILLLLIVLIFLLAVGSAPLFPYNANWQYGWGPSGFLVLILLVILLLYFFGMLPHAVR